MFLFVCYTDAGENGLANSPFFASNGPLSHTKKKAKKDLKGLG